MCHHSPVAGGRAGGRAEYSLDNSFLRSRRALSILDARSLSPVFYSAGVEDEAEAVPGVDTARRFWIGCTWCAAPNVQTAVAGYVGRLRCVSRVASCRLDPAADLH